MKSSQDKCLLRIKSIFGEFDLNFGKMIFVCDLLLFHLPHKIVNKCHKGAKHGTYYTQKKVNKVVCLVEEAKNLRKYSF